MGCSPWGRKSWTRLSDLKKNPKHTIILEKEMALHSSVLAWEIPRTGEPGGLQSVVARVVHDLVTKILNYYIND